MPSVDAGARVMELVERKPLLQMTADELIQAYMAPLTLGVYLSFFLYGLLILSLFLYFVKFRRDTWLNRIVVVLLACFTTGDTIASGIRIFRITVLHPNDLAYLLDVSQRPEDWICTLFFLCTILLCQLFLSFRILSFARKMSDWAGPRAKIKIGAMAAALALGWMACVGASAANLVVLNDTDNYMQLLLPSSALAQSFRKTSLIMPCVLCLMDVMIAVMMTMQYRKAKTGYGDSNRILEVLITVVVRNGVLVAIVMVVQFVVTFTAVLWGNFLPLAYGKLHALTVLCVLTEPRLAHNKWHKDQENAMAGSAGPVPTPHMDYTRPSQLASVSDGPKHRRRYSTNSSFERRRSDLLPFDGDEYDYSDVRREERSVGDGERQLRPGMDPRGVSDSTSSSRRSRDLRPGMMARKISEAPTASSGHTALNPGTPVYELKSGDVELGTRASPTTSQGGLVVRVDEGKGSAVSFEESKEGEEKDKDEKEQ